MRAWTPIRRCSYLATDVVERVDAAVVDLSALPGALLATVVQLCLQVSHVQSYVRHTAHNGELRNTRAYVKLSISIRYNLAIHLV